MPLGELMRRIARVLLPDAYLLEPQEEMTNRGPQNSIGIIIQPGPHTPQEYMQLALTNPEEVANLWGHTALFIRQNGRIVRAIGFDPHRLRMFSPEGLGVASGRRGTTGYYYDELIMFRSPDALIVEFPVGGGNGVHDIHLAELLAIAPHPGTGLVPHNQQMGYLRTYVTRDGERFQGGFDARLMGNCINSVVQVLTRSNLVLTFGGNPLDHRSIRDLTSAQGRLTRDVIRSPSNHFQLHDLDTGNHVVPAYTGHAMTQSHRVVRRMDGVLMTLNMGLLVLHWTGRVTARPMWLTGSYLSLANFMLSCLIEGIPSNSPMWRLPTRALQFILAAGTKLCFITAARQGGNAWPTAAWSFLYLLSAYFRRR